MSARNDLDVSVLTSYLEKHIKDFQGPLQIERFVGGQSNPSYLLKAGSARYVLRRRPFGKLLPSAHALDREFKILSLLSHTDVATPKVYHLCSDESVIGAMFYIMEYCQGVIYWDLALPQCNKASRSTIYQQMNQSLTTIHKIDLEKNGMSDYGKAGHFYKRQFKRWHGQYQASQTQSIVAMESLMAWLERNIPEDDEPHCLVHGDYRLDNLVFRPDDNGLIAILDWELSTIGHPLSDLANQCMNMRLPISDKKYIVSGLGDSDRMLLGIPTEEQYIDEYLHTMGRASIKNWHFYLGFSFFKLAAIGQGVVKRQQQGNAASEFAIELEKMIEPLAVMGLSITQQGSNASNP